MGDGSHDVIIVGTDQGQDGGTDSETGHGTE